MFEKMKTHISENKEVYIIGGTCLVVGILGGLFVAQSRSKNMVAVQKVLAWKSGDVTQNVIQTQLPKRGHPGNIIVCNETGIPFSSQNQAAKMMGISPSALSTHLKGKNPNAGGYTFTKLGEAA